MFLKDYLKREQFETWLMQQSLTYEVTLEDLWLQCISQNDENALIPLKKNAYIVTTGYETARLYREPEWWPYWVRKMKHELEEKTSAPMYMVQKALNSIQKQENDLKLWLYDVCSLELFSCLAKEKATEPLTGIYDDCPIDTNMDYLIKDLIALHSFPEECPDIHYYNKKIVADFGYYYAEIPCPEWLRGLHAASRMPDKRELETYGDLKELLKSYYGLDDL